MPDNMNFSPGDIIIDAFLIAGVDVRTRLVKFEVFENIKNPYTLMTAVILDCSDIINHFPGLKGNEPVNIQFRQPGMVPYIGNFILTDVNLAEKLENQRTQLYEIKAYSPHMYNLPIVTKSYKNITHTDAFTDVVNSYLNPNKPFVVQAQNDTLIGNDRRPYIIPGVQIFQALKGIITRARSAVDPSAVWVFFESQQNLVLDTMQHLIDTATPMLTFIERPYGMDFIQDQLQQEYAIISAKEGIRVSGTDQIQSVNQQVQTFDRYSNEYQTKNVVPPAYSGQGATPISNLSAPMPQYKHSIPIDRNAPPLHIEDFIAHRKHIASITDAQYVDVHVHFNSFLTVGRGAAVNTLAPPGDTNLVIPDKIAGPGLITELNHRVIVRSEKVQGTSTFRLLKAGFNY